MGTWGPKPWGNDTAADWYHDFMVSTKTRDRWLSGIKSNFETETETS